MSRSMHRHLFAADREQSRLEIEVRVPDAKSRGLAVSWG